MAGYTLLTRILRHPYLAVVLLFLLFAPAGMCEDYTIGSGDTLNINVYGHEDLTKTVQVNDAGNISFPLIGEIPARGLSVTRLSQTVSERLAAGYIINPQVTVVVMDYRSRKASILGKVKDPALYELKGRTTLLELISTAGGLAADAGQYAYVTRKVSDRGKPDEHRQEVIKINLQKLVEEGDSSQNILISDGDSIFISKMEKIYVTGEVKSARAYPYEEGLTVIKALTNAGGFTDKAAANGVRIIRQENGEEQVLRKVRMDDLVAPEDVIVVPERFF